MKSWVEPSGPVPAILAIIGEAPAIEEIKQGIPFCGKAGKVLDRMIKILSIPRDMIYITNFSKRPLGDDKVMDEDETAFFSDILRQEIRDVDPSIIMSLGAISTHYFLGDCIMDKVNAIPHAYRGRILIPSFHPAAMFYRPEKEKLIVKAFKIAKLALDGEIRIDSARTRKQKKMSLYTALCIVGHLFPGSRPVVYRVKSKKEKYTNINIKSGKEKKT